LVAFVGIVHSAAVTAAGAASLLGAYQPRVPESIRK